MRRDIAADPKATHYCKHCGLTMKPRDLFMCPVCDGDFCEPKKRANGKSAKRKETKK